MNALRKRMSLFQKDNPEERLIYQVMDLELIKYKGIQLGDILVGDEVYQAIEKCIEGFMWLYENRYSLERNVLDKLTEKEKMYYKEIMSAFSTFSEFMRTHMHLSQ